MEDRIDKIHDQKYEISYMINPDKEDKEQYINSLLSGNGLAIEEGVGDEDISNYNAAADLLKELDKIEGSIGRNGQYLEDDEEMRKVG